MACEVLSSRGRMRARYGPCRLDGRAAAGGQGQTAVSDVGRRHVQWRGSRASAAAQWQGHCGREGSTECLGVLAMKWVTRKMKSGGDNFDLDALHVSSHSLLR